MGSKSSQANSTQQTQQYDQRQVNTTTIDDRDTAYSYDLSNRSQDNSIRIEDRSDHSMRYTDNSDRSWSNWQDQSIQVSDSRDQSSYWSNWQDQRISVSDSSNRSYTDSRDQSSYWNNWQDQRISVSDTSDRSITDNSDRSTVYNVGTDAARIHEMNVGWLRDAGQHQVDALAMLGESAESLYGTAGSNALRAFEAATEASTDAWSATVTKGAGLIESLLKGANNTVQAARDISEQAITSYQPTENKSVDALKWAGIAAAAVAGVVLLPKLLKN